MNASPLLLSFDKSVMRFCFELTVIRRSGVRVGSSWSIVVVTLTVVAAVSASFGHGNRGGGVEKQK